MYNLVGFQTGLKFEDQKTLIKLIPGLEEAEILRFGVIHKNTFINSPMVLNKFGNLREYPNIFIAGQVSGVEGYLESAASGLYCAMEALRQIEGQDYLEFPESTMLASMMIYITSAINKKGKLEPMNANFGLLPPYAKIKDKKEKKSAMAQRSLEDLQNFIRDLLNGKF